MTRAMAVLVLFAAVGARAQAASQTASPAASPAASSAASSAPRQGVARPPSAGAPADRAASASAGSALALYRELRSVGLDESQVYRIRDVALDRGALHISFNDGTIAFTRAVNGRITGAFFEGEGEVLVSPPSQVERASLNLFTGAAILEQTFRTAYLRFNDETFAEMQPAFRPPENPQPFAARWDGVARTLADGDALRLLASFLDPRPDDRMLHVRVGGTRVGTFDVDFASGAREPVWVGQATRNAQGEFYDLWTSFALGGAQPRPDLRSGVPEQTSPEATLPEAPSDWLGIQHYRIRGALHPPHDMEGQAEITAQLRQAGRRLVLFELSRYLRVSDVSMRAGSDDVRLEFIQNEALLGSQLARRGNDMVAVVLPRALSAGERVELRFNYAGPVMSEAGGGLMYVGARGTWYPNRGLEMATYDMGFRYPQPWVLVATGKLQEQRTEGADQVARWSSERPVPLAGFNLGQYEHAAAKTGNVSVTAYAGRWVENSFPVPPPAPLPLSPPIFIPGRSRPPQAVLPPAPPPTPAIHAQQVADDAARAVQWFSERLGPFPFPSLSLAQMPGRLSQGWPGLVFLSSYAFVSGEQRSQQQISEINALLFGKLMPAHETAHQWWGDSVIWGTYRDQWLVEALANYCALLFVEQKDPAASRSVLDYYRRELLRKAPNGAPQYHAGPVTLGARLSSSKFPEGYEVVAYARGTWLIHMLHALLRDEAPRRPAHARTAPAPDADALLFRALHDLYMRSAGRKISIADLQQAFEAVLPESAQYEGHRSLDWFFNGWVEGQAMPRFELEDVKFAHHGQHLVATGKIVMRDAPNSLVTALPVYAVAETRQTLVGRVFADGPETAFQLIVPPGTRKLLLDPQKTVLTGE